MQHKSNEEWIASLQGERGSAQQEQAFMELGRILHERVFNYLLNHQPGIARLASFSNEEVATLAQDFVQETLGIISANDFAKLDQFDGRGSLEGWATVIARHQAGQELRRAYWHHTVAAPDEPEQIEASRVHSESSEDIAAKVIRDEMVAELWPTVERCLDTLDARQRGVFLAIVRDEQSTQDVAGDMGITDNTVYILLCRAKQKLRGCLDAADIRPDTFGLHS